MDSRSRVRSSLGDITEQGMPKARYPVSWLVGQKGSNELAPCQVALLCLLTWEHHHTDTGHMASIAGMCTSTLKLLLSNRALLFPGHLGPGVGQLLNAQPVQKPPPTLPSGSRWDA